MPMKNFEVKDNSIIASINPRIYPIDVVMSAAYVFTEDNYIILDGDPESEIIVQIIPKNNANLEKLGLEFNNELLNYAESAIQSAKTMHLRQILLSRALMTSGSAIQNTDYLEKEAKPWKQEDKEEKGS